MGETDDYPFTAKAGETWVFEVNAARSKSKLDSKLAILDAKVRRSNRSCCRRCAIPG